MNKKETKVANSIDYKTVQERMGHASFKTTMDMYVHRTQEMDTSAATIIDKVVCPTP